MIKINSLLTAACLLIATPTWPSEITLKWDPVATATGYILQHSSDLGVSWDSGTDVGDVITFIVPDAPDTGYQLYRVGAYNNNAQAIRYNAGIFHCGDCSPPPLPTGIGVQ